MRASVERNGARKRRYGAFALAQVLLFVFGFSFVASAGAAKVHLFEETFGGAAQPTFTRALGVVVDQIDGDVLVFEGGRNEVQTAIVQTAPRALSIGTWAGRTTST